MKRSSRSARAVSEEQVIAILREQETGAKTADVCRRHGISSATFYAWQSKFGGMDVSDVKRLKAFEASRSDGRAASNAKLKRLYADAMLDNAGRRDLLGRNVWSTLPVQRSSVVTSEFAQMLRPLASGPVFRPGHDEIRTLGFQLAGSGTKPAFRPDLPNVDRPSRHHVEPRNPLRRCRTA